MATEEEPLYTEEDVMRHAEEQEKSGREAQQWFVFKCVFLMLFILGVLLMAYPVYRVSGKTKMHYSTMAISNAKQVYLVLMDFEADYGYFPDDHTALKDPAMFGFTGSFSNEYLGQLIAGGYTRSEEIFVAKDKRYSLSRADDVTTPDTRILEKNECGFSYVLVEENGKRRGLTTKDNGGIPILAAPLANQAGSFEKSSFDNHGVYIRVDGAARSERLRRSDQKIKLPGGMTLFETGPGTVWGSLTPVVLLPER
jgi:hypothetical protein